MNEYLIVGHGLAGAVLAHQLLERGQKVVVIEGNFTHSASGVSVGLVNPLIGPKLNPPEKIQECLAANQSFYHHCEQAWAKSFYKPISFHRIFKSKKQQFIWSVKQSDSIAGLYTGKFLSSEDWEKKGLYAPHGTGLTKSSYQLDVSSFLQKSREKLQSVDAWESGSFSDQTGCKKMRVIFCEGFRVIENPLFKYLPFAPARGEVLRIHTELKDSLSNGAWHLPYHREEAFVGSTWDHQNLMCGPTEIGKSEIFQNCNYYDLSRQPLLDHLSGVRSGTKDRNPIMGSHPKLPNRYLFNGFGSRGTSTIPYYSRKMVDFLINQKTIPEAVNLSRFK
jgi:hypothetical protein